MKVFHFLRWQWSKFDTWQKVWMLGCFFFGAGINAEDQRRTVLWGIAGAIFFLWFLYNFIWAGIKQSWDAYNKEQEEIVRIMKEGVK